MPALEDTEWAMESALRAPRGVWVLGCYLHLAGSSRSSVLPQPALPRPASYHFPRHTNPIIVTGCRRSVGLCLVQPPEVEGAEDSPYRTPGPVPSKEQKSVWLLALEAEFKNERLASGEVLLAGLPHVGTEGGAEHVVQGH